MLARMYFSCISAPVPTRSTAQRIFTFKDRAASVMVNFASSKFARRIGIGLFVAVVVEIP